MNSSLLNELKKVFNDSGLSDREQKVLQYRFGLETGVPMTLKQTSEIFGVTVERIRQIEAKAIKDIRTGKAAKSLAYFFKDSDGALKKLDQIKRDYYS